MNFLSKYTTYFLIFLLFSANALGSEELVPDGSTLTNVDIALNNKVAIVNIATPSPAGVSLNNWLEYNVNNQGQILNNYKGLAVDTNLAGYIYGNPNFNRVGSSEATTIVNQVTGNNPTKIFGPTEIAGSKANLVIANGNGIYIAGASYINTSNLSLVAGSVNSNKNGEIDNFALSNKENSSIVIAGIDVPNYSNLGLDASAVDYVDIIARSTQIIGDIHAKNELNFKLGNDIYNYANKTIYSAPNLGVETRPKFALDSSYLGGMYAGRIILTATEEGVGVRTRGDLVSKITDIDFNTVGNINYEKLNAETNINLISSNGKIAQGKYANILYPSITYAKGDINIIGANGIELNNSLYSGGNLTIANRGFGNINHNYKSYAIGDATINNSGGDIIFEASNSENYGSLYSRGDLEIASSLNIVNNIDILSEGKINLTSQSLDNSMNIMAIGSGANENKSNLTINLDKNLLNRGLLYTNQDLNLNVDGAITNDASNDNAGEIFALNGNVNINGKIYATSFGNVSKYDLFYLGFDESAKIWENLLVNGYIDSSDKITDSFKELKSSSEMNIDLSFNAYKDSIYNILTNSSSKVIQSGNSNNSLDKIIRNFDSKAGNIYNTLQSNGYIDVEGKILQKFYNDTKIAGASGLYLENGADISYLKSDIYQLLQDVRNGKIIENSFLDITGMEAGNLSGDLINELTKKGYIDSSGNVTDSFNAIANYQNLDLSSKFDDHKLEIYNQINAIKSINKIFLNKLDKLAYQPLNSISNYATLYSKLFDDGYVDINGYFTSKFVNDGYIINAKNDLINYKSTLEAIFVKKEIGSSVSVADFNMVNYLPANNIDNANKLYEQLQNEGFIDINGNILEKFYTDGISSSNSSLINYKNAINDIFSNTIQAKIIVSSFLGINKSLDNSASRLVDELIGAGYLDVNGNKTAKFNFIDAESFATAFSSIASNGEYESAKTAIFNILAVKENSYSFRDSDFLGKNFDSNILYNENQILMDNLIASGYISQKGDIKSGFYKLAGNYTNLQLDNRFSGLKEQVGSFINSIAPVQAVLSNYDLIKVANVDGKSKAEQIFNQMSLSGYLNKNGDFTQKLMNDVMNYSGTDSQRANQLELGSLQEYANGVYQQLKAKNGITIIKNYATKLENLNGANISSSLGNVNIKANSIENIAQDNIDVSLSPENGVFREKLRAISQAWKNTVLYGYDKVVSILDSKQSSIKAGNIITIEANNIINNSSLISAGNIININTTNLSNSRTSFEVAVPYIYQTHWKKCKWSGCKSARYENWYQNKVDLKSNTPAIISSGNILNISAIDNVFVDAPAINNSLVGLYPLQNIINSDKSTKNNWQIKIPSNNNGLFKKAPPSKNYLIETVHDFSDPKMLTGSAYYISRFGFNPNQDNIKWLGDPFYEWNLINQQIIAEINKQQQWSLLKWQDNFNKLIDNAYSQQSDLNLVLGVKLTAKQVSALKSDIIWYENESIKLDDESLQQVIVPHIYLAKNNSSKINLHLNNPAESIFLASNININAGGDIINQGKILANSNARQPAGASGNLTLKSSGNIINKSTIKADNLTTLIAKENVINESTVGSIAIAHNGGTDIFSQLTKTAIIEAGEIAIKAEKNFENFAGQIKTNKNDLGGDVLSSGNFSAESSGDINISALKLRNRIEKTWGNSQKGGYSVDDKIINNSSEFIIANNLTLASSKNNINIFGSNLLASEDINMIAKNNINIANVEDESYSLIEKHKEGLTAFKKSQDMEQQINNISSNLKAGNNININSGSDSNIIASNLNAVNNVNILAGSYLDVATKAEIINNEAVINILSAKDSNYKYQAVQKIGINLGLSDDGLTLTQMNRNASSDNSSTQISSNISSSNGNINLISQNDLKIIASNIIANLGDINISSSLGNVDILSADNNSSNKNSLLHVENNVGFKIDSHQLALTAEFNGNDLSTVTNQKTVVSSNIIGEKVNIVSGFSSSFADSQNKRDKGNINIASSNLESTYDAVNLNAFNDINLLTFSNLFEQNNSSQDFSAHVKAGISYNFKDVWKSIENLKDVAPKNAVKYIAINSASNYLGAGVVSPYLATYGPMLASMGEGDSFDESLAKNSKYINDANTINNAGKGGAGSVGLNLELAYSQQKSGFKQSDVVSNNIFSNGNINLTSATSDLNIHSSNLNAEDNINLSANKGEVNIVADADNYESFSKSFAINSSIPLIANGGGGGIAFSKSEAESRDYINSSMVAGNQFNLNSGNDTNIISSNILASKVNMLIAGDLNLESRQNSLTSKDISFSLGGGFSSSGGGKSGSGNISYSKSVSDRDWVDNQASILGTDSVTINVGKNTNLVGSAIANITNANELGLGSTLLGGSESTRSATMGGLLNSPTLLGGSESTRSATMGGSLSNGIDGKNLTLNTNTLTYSNLYDSDFARSFGIGVGINARAGGSGGSGAKGSGSLTLNYSMHNYEQNTNAIIGDGNIKTGTSLNLGSNKNLIAVAGGTDYSGDLNRNIFESQVLTKSLTVDPIHIKETIEFGRNNSQNQMKANNKSTGNRTLSDDIKQSDSNESLIANIGSGLASNVGDTLINLAYQINPLRGFSDIANGISSDFGNLKTTLGIKTIVLDVGQERQFVNIDKDENQIGKAFTLADYLADPSLASNKLFSNGIMNNLNDAARNAKMQLGSTDENGKITILYDPSAKGEGENLPKWQSFKGLLPDLGEVSVNYLGANVLGGLIQTKGQATDEQFITAITNNAKETGQIITLAGHSGGGLRNYLALLNSNQNQYLNSSGESVLQVQFSGTPVNNQDLILASQLAGAYFVASQNKTPTIDNNLLADPVGLVLGGNGNIIDGIVGAGHILHLFKLFGLTSPHSDYGCAFLNCYSGELTNPIPKPNSQ